MNEALGLVEIKGLSTAVLVADTMVKTANVTLYELENTRGRGFITVKILGDVGAVNAAVTSGRMQAMESGKLISAKVIPRPSAAVAKWFCTKKTAEPEVKQSETDKAIDENKIINSESAISDEDKDKETKTPSRSSKQKLKSDQKTAQKTKAKEGSEDEGDKS